MKGFIKTGFQVKESSALKPSWKEERDFVIRTHPGQRIGSRCLNYMNHGYISAGVPVDVPQLALNNLVVLWEHWGQESRESSMQNPLRS